MKWGAAFARIFSQQRHSLSPATQAVLRLARLERDIDHALAERKANRPALKAQARSDASKRGWMTRRAGA